MDLERWDGMLTTGKTYNKTIKFERKNGFFSQIIVKFRIFRLHVSRPLSLKKREKIREKSLA